MARDITEPPPSSPTSLAVAFASVFVERLRVQNFRGLDDCTVDFEDDLTLLVGRNNSGKTRILRALAIVLGAIAAEADDLTVDGSSDVGTIDVVLAPQTLPGGSDEFDNRVRQRLINVQALGGEPVRERFAWRATLRPSYEGRGVATTWSVLVVDDATGEWTPQAPTRMPSSDQRSIVAADMVQTGRDLVEELTRRGSPIRRILDDLEIAANSRDQLEADLRKVGGDLMDASRALAALQVALEALSDSVGSMGRPSLTALPVRLEELARSVSIAFNTGTGDLPIRFHGAGVRSLSSLQVQSVLYDRRLGRDGPALRPHPVSLIEEPEAHLHPQAQFELLALLEHDQGQTIATTHSPHLASVVEPRAIRLLRHNETGTSVVDLHGLDDKEDVEKLRRLVERPFGELLFASAVVLGDGAMERALLPPLIRSALRSRAHGVCVVDTASMAGPVAKAVANFSNRVGIPWLLFSDSDATGVKAALKLVHDHGANDAAHIIWGGSGPTPRKGATELMFLDADRDLCEAACTQLGFDNSCDDLFAFMKDKKGAIGRLLANELLRRHPWVGDPQERQEFWPEPLCELISSLDQVLPQLSSRG